MKNAKGKEVTSESAWVDSSSPAKRIRAVAIVKDGQMVGKILVLYPSDGAGKLKVNLYDWTGNHSEVYYGWVSGCGYDKLSAALEGLSFGDNVFKYKGWDYAHQLREWGYEVFTLL